MTSTVLNWPSRLLPVFIIVSLLYSHKMLALYRGINSCCVINEVQPRFYWPTDTEAYQSCGLSGSWVTATRLLSYIEMFHSDQASSVRGNPCCPSLPGEWVKWSWFRWGCMKEQHDETNSCSINTLQLRTSRFKSRCIKSFWLVPRPLRQR